MDEPTLQGIERALENVRPHLPATPLLRSEIASRASGAEVWLKNETVSPIASFKLRGALNGLIGAGAGPHRGAVTSSTGNHGQGVAYAGRLLGATADIFLPKPANAVKAAMIDAFGGVVHEIGSDIDEAKDAARDFAERHERIFVDDGNAASIMEGAGTIGLEIAQQLADIDAVIIPMGGGNLSAGCATALKALQPGIKVIAVQAAGSPAMVRSFHARQPIESPTDTIADGLMTRVPPTLALKVLWERLDDAWLVSDEELLAAIHTLAECAHVLVEPAGAAGLAGLWQHRDELSGKRVVLVLTGANISAPLLQRALTSSPLFSIG